MSTATDFVDCCRSPNSGGSPRERERKGYHFIPPHIPFLSLPFSPLARNGQNGQKRRYSTININEISYTAVRENPPACHTTNSNGSTTTFANETDTRQQQWQRLVPTMKPTPVHNGKPVHAHIAHVPAPLLENWCVETLRTEEKRKLVGSTFVVGKNKSAPHHPPPHPTQSPPVPARSPHALRSDEILRRASQMRFT